MKKLIAIALAVVLLMTFCTGTALAEQPQASGGATIVAGQNVLSFTFHVRSTGVGVGTGDLHYFMHVPSYLHTRQIMCDVRYVRVFGNTVWFAGICTYDSYPEGADGNQVGNWLGVMAVDVNDDPGVGRDVIGRSWFGTNEEGAAAWVSGTGPPGSPPVFGTIVDGNIQVGPR
jgi:hypothetical protein